MKLALFVTLFAVATAESSSFEWLQTYKLDKKLDDVENRCVKENNLIEAPEGNFKPTTPEEECFLDCFHKGIGLINANGELDEVRFTEMARWWYIGENKSAEDAETVMKCASREKYEKDKFEVKDVEGCQKGVVIHTCIFLDGDDEETED